MRRIELKSKWVLAVFLAISALGFVQAGERQQRTAPALGSTLNAELPAALPKINLRVVPGLEEPLVSIGATTAAEDETLNIAITLFRSQSSPGDISGFEHFINQFPQSNWQTSIQTNLGLIYYRGGYFTRAMAAWEAAWNAGRDATDPQVKALADRAVGELARMHARLGHAAELEKLFTDIGNRPISGPATEMITGAHEGLWMFHNEPGISYLCGPMALKNLLKTLNASPQKITLMDKQRSGTRGFNFAQVAALAQKAGLEYQLVYRSPDQPVPVPSVINWKLHHYAAIVGEKDGRYHIQDPTFASGDAWIGKEAIDEEASGIFLVPAKKANEKTPWRNATNDEIQLAYGMGYTAQNQPGCTTGCDANKNPPPDSGGMTVDNAKSMVVSLSLSDTPVGYQAPVGPSAKVRITYSQREANQPAVFSFFNISPKWTLNVLSWVQDNPTAPGSSVIRYALGGGSIDYTNGYSYNASTGAFSSERQGESVLVRVPATGPVSSYELRMSDGSKQVFAFPDGATTTPRRIFLTQLIDSVGNALTYHYDSQLRLTSITDATGRNTTLGYGLTSNPLLVTQITDPFGRHADLAYDGNGRLSSITDVIGLTSSFSYDSAGLVNAMTTPYGTSHFTYGDGTNNTRYLETTDPLGYTDRLEFRHQAPGIPLNDPVAPAGLGISNIYLYYRNTFYWDKSIYPVTHTDYTKAAITHWLHNPIGQTSPIIESTKQPLERRVWRTYPGQAASYYEGTTGTPISISRVLDDGTTEAIKVTYNSFGKPLTVTDPSGRVTRYTYATNNIDVMTVEQKTSASGYSTTASFTYNAQHLPLAYTDASGKIWTFTYNSAGQVTSQIDPLNQATNYEYNGQGYLTRVVNPNGKTASSYTYDSFGRIGTRTDSEGYITQYTYDNFDRVTRVDYPDGTFETYNFDRLDLASTTDRFGRTTHYAYDANRRLISIADPLNRTTSYDYYPNGTLKSLTDPKGNTTTWARDIQSRVTSKTYVDGKGLTYTYEASTSRLKSITDALGQTKNFVYTIDDRPTGLNYTNAINATPSVNFVWDAYFPHLISMADGNGTTNFQYKPPSSLGALQLALEDGPYNNDTVTYSYDGLGRIAQRTVDSATDNFTYDTLGRLIDRNNALGDFTYQYLGETEQPASVAITGSPIQTQWNYENNAGDRRLKSILQYGQARSFGLVTRPQNIVDQITETTSGVQKSWNYAYDNVDRLLTASSSVGQQYNYAYDNSDNITSIQSPVGNTSYSYNNLNQPVGGATQYDANGNLIADDLRTYKWDAENRLIAIAYKASPGKETDFRYDGLGRRIAIVEKNGTAVSETRYTWCIDALCQARTSADAVTRRYFPEGEVWPQGGTKLYYAKDQAESVRDVLVAQTGSKVASYDYDAYGNITSAAGRTSVDFRYAGMFYHQPSNIYFTLHREYDPKSGRWLSRDPIEEKGGINLYAYVNDQPLTHTDSSGTVANPAELTCFVDPAQPICWGGVIADIGTSILMGGSIAAMGSLSGDTPQDQAAQRQAEYERAKNFCDTPPEPGGNDCSTLSKQIDHAQQCINLYKEWDAKWYPGRHDIKIQDWENRLENLKTEHKLKCTNKCP